MRVERGANQHQQVAQPPQQGLDFLVVDDAEQGLRVRLGRAAHIVREWRGDLDLQTGDVAHGEAEDAGNCHRKPEVGVEQLGKAGDLRMLAEYEDEWREDDARVEVVVERQLPDVIVDAVERLFRVDRIQSHKQARHNAIEHSAHG